MTDQIVIRIEGNHDLVLPLDSIETCDKAIDFLCNTKYDYSNVDYHRMFMYATYCRAQLTEKESQ